MYSKPVFKGHDDERTPTDQGTLSQNGVLSSPMLKNLWWRDTCHIGTLYLGYINVSPEDRFYCNILQVGILKEVALNIDIECMTQESLA